MGLPIFFKKNCQKRILPFLCETGHVQLYIIISYSHCFAFSFYILVGVTRAGWDIKELKKKEMKRDEMKKRKEFIGGRAILKK